MVRLGFALFCETDKRHWRKTTATTATPAMATAMVLVLRFHLLISNEYCLPFVQLVSFFYVFFFIRLNIYSVGSHGKRGQHFQPIFIAQSQMLMSLLVLKSRADGKGGEYNGKQMKDTIKYGVITSTFFFRYLSSS